MNRLCVLWCLESMFKQSLIYDASLVKSLKAKLAIVEGKDAAPETRKGNNRMFDSYWLWAADVLYDRCRVNGRPNCWITISPREWLFPKHSGLFGRCTKHKDLSRMQGLLTLHRGRTQPVYHEWFCRCMMRAPSAGQTRLGMCWVPVATISWNCCMG